MATTWRFARGVLLAFAVALLACLSGVSPTLAAEPSGGSISDGAFARDAAGRQLNFALQIAQDGDPIRVDFRGNVAAGSLHAVVVDASGSPVSRIDAGSGPFDIGATLTRLPAGDYRLGVEWDGPVRAVYSLAWRPGGAEAAPTVTPVALLGGAGMVLVAVGFVAFAALRRLGWRYLMLGALAWIVTVALKFAWAIPLNPPLYDAATGALPELLATPLFSVYVGALTGLFEVGITYLVLRYTRFGRAPWRSALAFGIGFGAVEALLLGFSSLASAGFVLANPRAFAPSQLESFVALSNPLVGLAPAWERFFTVWVHILANVLIFYAVAVRQPRWFWLAFAYKTAIDSFAGYGQLVGVTPVGGAFPPLFWALEAAVGVFGVVGWIYTWHVARRYPKEVRPVSATGLDAAQ